MQKLEAKWIITSEVMKEIRQYHGRQNVLICFHSQRLYYTETTKKGLPILMPLCVSIDMNLKYLIQNQNLNLIIPSHLSCERNTL